LKAGDGKNNNGGWIEAKRKNSKGGSKESSVKSSTSNTSSGTQVEKMKKIIREEGRDARNLLYWTVPPVPQQHDKTTIYGRSKSETRLGCITQDGIIRGRTPRASIRATLEQRARLHDLRARNWGALFESLRLAVDKIYTTCEQDQSIPECKETILYIETYLHEFTELKKLLELKREHDFENNNGKCKGISWEIRKTSPGPRRHPSESDKNTTTTTSPVKTPRSPREPEMVPDVVLPDPNSWAAKVRGVALAATDQDGGDGGEKPNQPIVPRLKLDEIGEDIMEDDDDDDDEEEEEVLTPTNEESDWGDMMMNEEGFKDFREPGRLASVHEKLMSPSRKKTAQDSEAHRIAIEARQKEAAKRREEIQRSKAEKVRKIAEKVESVQKNKTTVQMEKQKKLDQKMRRAELNKETNKTNFKAKLKDESQKIREANFIQELEMDIKRVETVKKIKKYHQQTEKHASTLEEQNKLKIREIEQKERAVIERKRKLESERQDWVEGLNRRRDERLQVITQRQHNEKMSMIKAAKEKENKRDENLRQIRETEEKEQTEAKNKIILKHSEAEKRRLEELEKKKGKAVELAGYISPRSLVSSSIVSTSFVVSRKLNFDELVEQKPVVEEYVDVSLKNNKKNHKKKIKKIKTRINQRQEQFEEQLNGTQPPPRSKGKLGKLIGDITRSCALQSRDGGQTWPPNRQSALDRSLMELNRLVGGASLGDTVPLTAAFVALLQQEQLAERTIRSISNLLRQCRPICCASLMASPVPVLIIDRVTTTSAKEELGSWHLLDSLAWLMISSDEAETGAELAHHASLDTIQYGLTTELFTVCDECTASELGLNGTISSAIFAFLTACIRTLLMMTNHSLQPDFVSMLKKTELLGAVSVLYGSIVLERNSQSGTEGIILNAESERTSMLVLQAINYCSILDLEMVQAQLSSTDMTSQFRSVIQCLLTSNVPANLKHEAILTVCYFIQSNTTNQEKIGQGEQPTILQQLCLLPFNYYTDEYLKSVLFPTMCCACYNNENNCHIVAAEVSLVYLASYLKESEQKTDKARADKWSFANRFPVNQIDEAIAYFQTFADENAQD